MIDTESFSKQALVCTTMSLLMVASCHAAEWKPERGVEIVAPSGAGSSTDRTARVVQRILQEQKLVEVPVTVVNRPGGSGTIGLSYVNQHPRDGHYLIIATTAAISNHIMGLAT